MTHQDGTVTVFWDLEASQSEATVTYKASLPEGSGNGDELRFQGVLENEDGRHQVDGDQTTTVVRDVFADVDPAEGFDRFEVERATLEKWVLRTARP